VTREELLERVVVDPEVCFGRPVIRGTRIWVALILENLADGRSVAQIVAEYPQLTELDVRAALAYAASTLAGPRS
jgi:uncharacterized protein (DUF433 family)